VGKLCWQLYLRKIIAIHPAASIVLITGSSRGIIAGMQSDNFDETRPMRLDGEAASEADDASKTRQTNIKPIQPPSEAPQGSQSASLEETRATAVSQERSDQASAFDETQRMAAFEPESAHAAPDEDLVTDGSPAFAETMPVTTQPEPQPDSPGEPPTPGAADTPPIKGQPSRRTLSLGRITLIGILLLIMIAVLSGFAGYSNGISQRLKAQNDQALSTLGEQFELAVQDIETGRYELARQRLEYIIELDPGYPGVTERLADVLTAINTKATPTPRPTPTLTPTPDTRGIEERFIQAQQDIANQNWSAAIDTLLNLRKGDPSFQAVQVDGMLYIAFRNRGVDKILRQADLEGGMYDLAVAGRIGPLDADAQSYETWARIYITGASFWELNWGEAVYYFAQVAPALPNLMDGSRMTAAERYRLALIGYGGFLAENKEWCAAAEQYQLALSLGANAEVEQQLELALQQCSGESDEDQDSDGEIPPPTATVPPQDTAVPSEEPTPTEPAPTPEPSPTQEPPPEEPTATPTP
jgi:tetratricopeptide (TPR) repeat protein